MPRTLRQVVRQNRFEIRVNSDFRDVMENCMSARPTSWINPKLIDAYCELHRVGHAHSVEAWQDGQLAGGLYGVSLGGAFFGESMFHRVRDASKVALVHLVERLKARGFELLDSQATTEHLERFGAIEVTSDEYLVMLRRALMKERHFV